MKPAYTKQYPKLRWYEDMRFWRIFEFGLGIVAVLALLASLYGNYQAYIGLEQAREEAEESRIVNAWQILSNRSPGNTGKKAALETLNNAKENLRRIDLSCETMGGMDENNKSCDTPTFLSKVSLPNADLIRANLSDAILREANLSGAILFRVNLSDAILFRANLSDAILLGANLSDADLSFADLSAANLWEANLSDSVLRETNLSNVNFCDPHSGCAKNLTQAQIDQAWAWADRAPIFKAGEHQLDLAPPPLCPVELRPEYEAKNRIGKPHGC